MDYNFHRDEHGNPYLEVDLSGYALISNPILNKGTAFPENEREAFGLFGILPPCIVDLETQLARTYETLHTKSSDLEKYIYLRDLQDSNETLFYRLLLEHIEELTPIVYTPTVGLGCQRFSHIYRRPRGIFISYPHRDFIDSILAHPRFDRATVIVVSDGERILGLGDQGAGGMGIPIGKLALYTACAGIHPATTLPILLDTGTNNPALLNDPLYIGWRHERLRGQDYDDFVDLFVNAVKKRFQHVLLQWEDFAQRNANPLLARYKNQLCTFNDDIQGTAAVATGTLLAAIKVTGKPLKDQIIVVVGAGSAGCGISMLIKQAMMEEGLSEHEASQHFFMIDQSGLLLEDTPGLLPFQKPFAQSRERIASWQLQNPHKITLKDVVHYIHPTVLIGVSGQPGIFSEDVIREMAQHVERPIIFPLSNPTERAEAIPADLIKWTQDKVIIGTGSPFQAILKNGKPFRIDQTNNSYIFPGLGLGLIAVKAQQVTDTMLMVAAKALAECSPTRHHADANLLPSLVEIRRVSYEIALAVANEALHSGLSDIHLSEPIENHIKRLMWMPDYVPYQHP